MSLVEITPATHNVDISLAYASYDNFTGAPIYTTAVCYLHVEAEKLFTRARDLAAVHGFRLKIFDAFRPTEAQWALWNHTPDPNYIADPRRGSPHSRGAAVDLTLLDRNRQELEMGTPFDDFSTAAHHGSMVVSATAQKNRALLLGLMTAAGWDFFRNEWWHYQLFDSRQYPTISDSALPKPMMA
ncbi:MAG: D-alanyl-D-alanine dipeptidase [Rhodospirillaceae bacterium]|jgi:D-alanyl-D-alanine dipeptidase